MAINFVIINIVFLFVSVLAWLKADKEDGGAIMLYWSFVLLSCFLLNTPIWGFSVCFLAILAYCDKW